MRHFPYAPRTQGPPSPQGNLRGDGDDDAQQQPPQPQQQRDTMSDVQEQFSKLAESTFAFPSSPHPAPETHPNRLPPPLWASGINLAARCLRIAYFLPL